MNTELDKCLAELEATRGDIVGLVESLDDSQLHWQAGEGVWTVCDCVAHLIASAKAMIPVQEAAIARAREQGVLGEGPFRYGFIGRKFLEMLAPPPKRKFKAPQVFSPSDSAKLTKDELLKEFNCTQDLAIKVIRSADGLDLRRVKVASPVSKMLRFNLGISLLVLSTHQRRHHWQMCRVLENKEFPCISKMES